MRRQGVSGSKRRGGIHRTVDCGGRGSYYRSGQVTTFINNAVAQTKKLNKRRNERKGNSCQEKTKENTEQHEVVAASMAFYNKKRKTNITKLQRSFDLYTNSQITSLESLLNRNISSLIPRSQQKMTSVRVTT